MAAKKNDTALLNKGKIEIKCVVTQKEDYVLRIPKVGFYASSRTKTLEVSKSGLIAIASGDELDMDFQVIRLRDKKVIAEGVVSQKDASTSSATDENVSTTKKKEADKK